MENENGYTIIEADIDDTKAYEAYKRLPEEEKNRPARFWRVSFPSIIRKIITKYV